MTDCRYNLTPDYAGDLLPEDATVVRFRKGVIGELLAIGVPVRYGADGGAIISLVHQGGKEIYQGCILADPEAIRGGLSSKPTGFGYVPLRSEKWLGAGSLVVTGGLEGKERRMAIGIAQDALCAVLKRSLANAGCRVATALMPANDTEHPPTPTKYENMGFTIATCGAAKPEEPAITVSITAHCYHQSAYGLGVGAKFPGIHFVDSDPVLTLARTYAVRPDWAGSGFWPAVDWVAKEASDLFHLVNNRMQLLDLMNSEVAKQLTVAGLADCTIEDGCINLGKGHLVDMRPVLDGREGKLGEDTSPFSRTSRVLSGRDAVWSNRVTQLIAAYTLPCPQKLVVPKTQVLGTMETELDLA